MCQRSGRTSGGYSISHIPALAHLKKYQSGQRGEAGLPRPLFNKPPGYKELSKTHVGGVKRGRVKLKTAAGFCAKAIYLSILVNA